MAEKIITTLFSEAAIRFGLLKHPGAFCLFDFTLLKY